MKCSLGDLKWLAGLLEGEGCFTAISQGTGMRPKHPVILLTMSDKDVVQKAARLLDGRKVSKMYTPTMKSRGAKPCWRAQVTCTRAVDWMKKLYPFMGKRRKTRIRQLVAMWKAAPEKRNAILSR